MPAIHNPRAILITGGSSGIGRALAEAYAAPGVTLAISGRDPSRLGEAAIALRARGATVDAVVVDVADRDAMTAWIRGVDAASPLDLVIANAGISAGTGGNPQGEPMDQARRIFATNLVGVLNTVEPALLGMRARRAGQLALMSSLAGWRGFPGAPAYAASKSAVKVWGEGLRQSLGREGIRVSVVMPGFVVSRMTAENTYKMPFLMPAERAAAIIIRGLAANRARIAFPWQTAFAAWLAAMLPPALVDPVLARLPEKRAKD